MEMERLEILQESPKSKVYLVYDQKNHRMVVEKHLAGNISIYQKLKDLSHPYLPKIYEVYITSKETVVLEEYINGESLEKIRANEIQLTQWILELCRVLTFLHQHNILHRDIKPSNLLLGSDGHIRLIDFDAAREEKEEAESDTRLLGTRGYAPPEQYGFAQTDERADIYALGVTFQELLGETAQKHRWKHILKKCTAIEAKKRYHHTWQIQRAILFGQFRRRILYPILAFMILASMAFATWIYTTDADARTAINIVISPRRDLIFDTMNIDALKHSDITLQEFRGDQTEIYRQLKNACPDGNFISTGYCNEEGHLLFGSFSEKYDILTGERHYFSFEGLCYISVGLEVCFISPDKCEAYAPAVMQLYQLDIFDTPLF